MTGLQRHHPNPVIESETEMEDVDMTDVGSSSNTTADIRARLSDHRAAINMSRNAENRRSRRVDGPRTAPLQSTTSGSSGESLGDPPPAQEGASTFFRERDDD